MTLSTTAIIAENTSRETARRYLADNFARKIAADLDALCVTNERDSGSVIIPCVAGRYIEIACPEPFVAVVSFVKNGEHSMTTTFRDIPSYPIAAFAAAL